MVREARALLNDKCVHVAPRIDMLKAECYTCSKYILEALVQKAQTEETDNE